MLGQTVTTILVNNPQPPCCDTTPLPLPLLSMGILGFEYLHLVNIDENGCEATSTTH